MSVRIPDHIRVISPYVPGKPIEEAEREIGRSAMVKLASNENPLGPSPRAVQAIRETAAAAHRYPDASGHDLREALARVLGIPMPQIVLGNGSTEIVEILAKALLSSRRGAVVATPAFIMYRIAVKGMGAPLREIPLRDDRHDLRAMAEACDQETAMVYIGNPNNPTGTCVTRAEMDDFFARLPAHVLAVIDEAYRDYVEAPDYPDALDDLRGGANVAVLRTFSKIHGLAGIRIGYGVMPRDLAGALEGVRSPFNTSMVAQAAALAALGDLDHVRRSRSENSRERAWLAAELERRGIAFVGSVANFLLVQTSLECQDLYMRVLREGVIVRPMDAYGLPRSVRVTVGTRDQNRCFLEALDMALSGSSPGGPS